MIFTTDKQRVGRGKKQSPNLYKNSTPFSNGQNNNYYLGGTYTKKE